MKFRFGAALAGLVACLLAPAPARAQSGGATPEVTAEAPTMVERHPAGGLSYQLLLGPAGRPAETLRVAVWMHPSGGHSFNKAAETLAPVFFKHGFAMLLPIDKDFRGWTYEDAGKLLGSTLPDAGEIEGIDLHKPLLLGFSAGGQVALEFWMTKPDLYGGLILDAAHPVEERDGKAVVFAPPAGEATRTVPVLAFVGEQDPLAYVWRTAEEPWRKAGVPLTVRFVPDRGHEWLFGEEQVRALDEWLEANVAPVRDQIVAPPHEEPAPAVHP